MRLDSRTCPRCTGGPAETYTAPRSDLEQTRYEVDPQSSPRQGEPAKAMVGQARLYLVATGGPSRGACLPIGPGRTKLGKAPRAEAETVCHAVADEYVSREHVLLEILGDVVTLHDLHSTNGTFVNGVRVVDSLLQEGDRVQIGSSVFRVEYDPAAADVP
jgi:hypothetical protein